MVLAYLAGVTAVGIRLGRGRRTTREYFLGAKDLPWWAVACSIVATETSTLTVIGAPALAYTGDLTFLQLPLGYVAGRIGVALWLVPPLFHGDRISAYELVHDRLGPRTRDGAAFLFQGTRLLADGVRLFATALVLSVALPVAGPWAIVAVVGATLLYTWRGGLRAVVWTDVMQLIIYVAGGLAALAILLARIPGGWEEVVASAGSAKLRVLDLGLTAVRPYTLWAGLIGGGLLSLASHGTDQLMVQRLLAARSAREAQRAVVVSGLVVFFQFLLFLLVGTLLFVFYAQHPRPEPLATPDAVFPTFVVQELPAGLAGLVVAALFAAAMSTLSSSLNSLSSSSLRDVYQPYLRPQADESHYLKMGRLFTLAWAVGLGAVALLARSWGSVLEAGLTIASFTYGPLLGLFALGLLWGGRGDRVGLAGLAGGITAVGLVVLLSDWAWTWYVPAGLGGTVLSGALWLLLTGRRKDEIAHE